MAKFLTKIFGYNSYDVGLSLNLLAEEKHLSILELLELKNDLTTKASKSWLHKIFYSGDLETCTRSLKLAQAEEFILELFVSQNIQQQAIDFNYSLAWTGLIIGIGAASGFIGYKAILYLISYCNAKVTFGTSLETLIDSFNENLPPVVHDKIGLENFYKPLDQYSPANNWTDIFYYLNELSWLVEKLIKNPELAKTGMLGPIAHCINLLTQSYVNNHWSLTTQQLIDLQTGLRDLNWSAVYQLFLGG